MRLLVTILSVLVLSIPLLVQADNVPPPSVVRSVQVAAYRTDTINPKQLSNYEAVNSRLLAERITPLWEFERNEGELGTWKYLLVGRCERFIDAYLIKNELRKMGYEGAYEVAYLKKPTNDFSGSSRFRGGIQFS